MAATPLLTLNQPVSVLPGIGDLYAKKLERLNIFSIDDLIHHFPFRFDDVSATKAISSLQEGDTISLIGTIIDIRSNYTKTGKTMQKALFSDGNDILPITWFNQPYLVKTLKNNPQISISGKIKRFGSKLTLTSPQFELRRFSEQETIHTGRLVPIYPETAGVSSKWLRQKIKVALDHIPTKVDWAPTSLLKKYQLESLQTALQQIHFPDSQDEYQQAKHRLSFDELLTYQLVSLIRKSHRQQLHNHFRIKNKNSLNPFIQQLPYELTPGQVQSLNDILEDFSKDQPMNRLLQADVGAGKTVVAACAAHVALQSGFKTICMVPTETLANQHYQTFQKLFKNSKVNIELATKSVKNPLKSADIVIGTQALLHRQLPENIGFVIIDEQHRFGVKQRNQLLDKNKVPHLLSLTATPIPRTVALTLYSEIDISAINDMPPGRKPVKTFVVSKQKRANAYAWIKDRIKIGEQAYIVCPLINPRDPDQVLDEVKAVKTEFDYLRQYVFPELNLGLIHGQLKSKDKDEVIQQFSAKKIDILVATPVIEVGIDIKNATIMMIEGAERFGLASLHQLRGRVGRGDQQSYCLLFPTNQSSNSIDRLKQMEKYNNGLKLAEVDLKMRGPGNLYGTQQSGYIDLKIASLHDTEVIKEAHFAAKQLLKNDPELHQLPHLKQMTESILNPIIHNG